ncbi:hypothetical protein [Actinomycetospora sp. NBRC 106378]|uniref:hypothetical protein n=1 Tax=Actinomycetospora sp. NBRC 106378 TaxID=3032208 RepID=UPI0024A5082F|nr:hypothetical protein [Actinomycetospora sp. NBRC 106378]GLZ55963.1 hypothetical protein Acsp07_55800 [Actinomycetospora sp. NBRC 106378]
MLVLVRYRFDQVGSWSASLIADGGVVARTATCATGREAATRVAALLIELARAWARPVTVVHDLEGDRRAFVVVARVEGFLDVICEQIEPPWSA